MPFEWDFLKGEPATVLGKVWIYQEWTEEGV